VRLDRVRKETLTAPSSFATGKRFVAPPPSRPKQFLFVLGSGYLPGVVGGANLSLHALCLRLRGLGHEPVVFCTPGGADAPPGWPVPDYPVIRVPQPLEGVREMIAHLRPYAVVLRGPHPGFGALAWAAAAPGRKVHIYFTTASFEYSFPPAAPGVRYAANSPFLASYVHALVGRPALWLPSLVEPEACRCAPRGDAILVVHPAPVRGAHLAAAIAARLPHRLFLFARLPRGSGGEAEIEPALPNIESVTAAYDPRPLFERTRLLLMPSMHEEAWGRVVTEAQISGIPAVASDRGGLAENVGAAGSVLPLGAPIVDWCAAIEALLGDDTHYEAASRAARAQAARPELQPESVVAHFLEFVAS
jgi:glycosyltransferase involved in cell wall biosynthesis